MRDMPPMLILNTESVVEYFIDHLENLIGAEEFLIEVLHYLVEAMEDWGDWEKNIHHSIEYELYEHGFGDVGPPDEVELVRDCMWKVANAVRHEVEQFRLYCPYQGFPYAFHQLLGNCVVLARKDLHPKGGTNYLRSYHN